MKVVVLNYTGTVGKTTIAAHLLSPRMNQAAVFAIETINESADSLGVDVEKLRGQNFRELFKKLLVLDDAIIDVGASNIEAFLDGLVKFEDSHLEFDRFIVPVTSGSKEQKETISMVNTLSACGVEPNKIRIVFNRVVDDVASEFAPIVNFGRREQKCIVNENAAIFENELFDLLSLRKITIDQALEDPNDYKALAKEALAAGDMKTVSQYTDLQSIKLLSKNVVRNMDAVYSALFN